MNALPLQAGTFVIIFDMKTTTFENGVTLTAQENGRTLTLAPVVHMVPGAIDRQSNSVQVVYLLSLSTLLDLGDGMIVGNRYGRLYKFSDPSDGKDLEAVLSQLGYKDKIPELSARFHRLTNFRFKPLPSGSSPFDHRQVGFFLITG